LFKRLLRERIGALNDELNPGFGYDLIRLSIVAAEPLASRQLHLEGGEDQQGGQTALISQLSTRLGRERVTCFQPADSHIPEQGLLALPVLDAPAAPAGAPPHSCRLCSSPSPPPNHPQGTIALGGWEGEMGWNRRKGGCLCVASASEQTANPPMRPLHLFDPPQHVQVIAEVPDGPPHRFTWRRKTHRVIRYEGPERIASEWWTRKDGQEVGKGGLTRDYYRVEDIQGRRYWMFRHGLYGDEKANPDWYVHGLFA
jgi:protein ImuB